MVFDVLDVTRQLGLSLPIQQNPLTLEKALSTELLGWIRRYEAKIYDQRAAVSIESAKLLSPILNPEKLLLVAANYASHNEERKIKPPSEPYFFTKLRNALIGPGEPILIPKIAKAVDWEVELAVIIGTTGKYISRKDAMSYVAGYTISNDVSFRDLQYSTASTDGPRALGINWLKGKSLDSSFPLGPWLVTKD